jgi:hypothetical protein
MLRAWLDRYVQSIAVTVGLVIVCALVVSASASAGPPAPRLVRIELAPRVPVGAHAAGALRADTSLSGTVVLAPRSNAALQQFIAQVTNRRSPLFHHYLQRGAFAGRFGPTAGTIAAVRSVLRSDGLRVTGLSSDRVMMSFKGSTAQVERAFHTRLENYRLANGSLAHATTSPVTLPSTIAGSVTAVLGLNDLVREQPAGIVRQSASALGKFPRAKTGAFAHPPGAPDACPAATADAESHGGLTDDQIANAYGAFGLYGAGDLGAGQHIAIYELEPFLRSDVQTFDTCYFGASQAASMMSRLHVISIDGGQPEGPGSGESILDVEDVSALAPDADIDVYEAPSYGVDGVEYDPVDEYVSMVDSDVDQVISSSWGLCEQAVQLGQPGLQQAENIVFEQAAAQGQSIFSASGDTGDDTCNELRPPAPAAGQNPLSVGDPASQPYVVGVGGTTITDAATSPPQEHVWNDGANGGGGGGGISETWTMPTWQQDATVPGIALPGSADYTNANHVEQEFGYPTNFCQSDLPDATSSTPCRLVPDVSAQADENTGVITIYAAPFGGWLVIGGTSSSTPIWAALLADINASSTCASQAATRNGVGFVNPLLYAVASNPTDYAASFNDITAGNNDIYGLDNGLVFPARTGYDEASGLGSPRLTDAGGTAGLAFYLCSYAASASRPAVLSVSPDSGSIAGGEDVTINGSGFESGGKPDVAGIEVGGAQISASHFAVHSPTRITAVLPRARETLPALAPAPQDGSGPAQIIVTLKDDESSAAGPDSRFVYVDKAAGGTLPSVAGIVPVAGRQTSPTAVRILGAGFGPKVTRVTFGGVNALSFTVDGPDRITATPPSLSSSTACAPLPSSGVFAGENRNNDICQVQVRVFSGAHSSAAGHILPPPEGPFAINSFGVQVAPSGCACELQPAPTEYDYVPVPRITSVSTSSGPASLASEAGGTVVTLHGVGFNPMTIDWVDFGGPALESSIDESYVFVTGTEIQIVAPPEPVTVEPAEIRLSVKSLAGTSPAAPVANATYAGVPQVTGVVNTTNSTQLNGVSGAADTGGTPIQISGSGFANQLIAPIEFADTQQTGSSFGTQYTFTVNSDTSVSTQTVSQNAGLVDVEACTVSGCSLNRPADELWLYAPGDPTVSSVSPSSGPTGGGTPVSIGGQNLGCTLQVFFGSTAAESFTQPTVAGSDCGSTSALDAVSPAGTSGTSVPVTAETVESYFTGAGNGTSTADFSYP